MKRIYIVIILLTLQSLCVHAQIMQASIGAGTAPTRVKIYIRPSSNVNGFISTLQFDVAIPAAVTPAPTLSIVGTPTLNWGWLIDPSYIEAGYRHYQISTGSSPLLVLGAGVETEVMELQFSGGPSSASNVYLVTLPWGGSNGNAIYWCSGAANSLDGSLYYPRAGTTVVNNFVYFGGTTAYASVGNIVLPLRWLSFETLLQGNSVDLKWSVSNDESTHQFEVQRSFDGISYSTIAVIDKIGNFTGNQLYHYSDSLINISAAGRDMIFYRIRKIDQGGQYSISPERMIRPTYQSRGVSIFPNPVKRGEGIYIVVPEEEGGQSIRMKLFNSTGLQLYEGVLNPQQKGVYYHSLYNFIHPPGLYYMQIHYGGHKAETKKIIIGN